MGRGMRLLACLLSLALLSSGAAWATSSVVLSPEPLPPPSTLAAAQSPDKSKAWALTPDGRQELRRMQRENDYLAIARAYAEFMIDYGRDCYGKQHSPLFVSIMACTATKLSKIPQVRGCALPRPSSSTVVMV